MIKFFPAVGIIFFILLWALPGGRASAAGNVFAPREALAINYSVIMATTSPISPPPATATSSASTAVGFTFTYMEQKFPVSADALASWQGQQTVGQSNIFIPPPESIQSSLMRFLGQEQTTPDIYNSYAYRLSDIYNFIQNLASQLNSQEVEPVLNIQNNLATNFTPPKDGLQTDVYKSALDALAALSLGKTGVELTVNQTMPQTTLSQTNNLGINQLIAEGVSTFNGSPNNRRHNIAAGITKFAGVIIPRGATFSFDDDLGPVTAEAGFLPELVIDGGNTLPELGGGLCQVSTTVFRAAMAAGVPITDRRNHAYAVSYYSPQGTDATIYPGSADLKFVNDTPGAILIWPYEKDKNTLVFDFYGTDDGRKVTLEKPVVYDRQSDGAMKATWTRLVTSADGQTRTDVFNSNYQPPALFHETEKYIPAASSTPASNIASNKVQ